MKKPCNDCPWRRCSAAGWTGALTPQEWVAAAHGEDTMLCHTAEGHCVGAAIYRANVGKLPRDRELLRQPKDTAAVFASPVEFIAHHSGPPRRAST